ncbi:MAG: SPOR domain-containing protein [Ignavibacteriaceae bacterium]
MTRAELVKKLTSYAVVDDVYAALFMESFLMLLHQRLRENDTFVLPIQISFSQQKIVRENEEFYLITCSSKKQFDNSPEDLVFAVPAFHDEKVSGKYSVFSISIGKQTIPTKEMLASGFSFEPNVTLKNYLRGKAENLFRSGEFKSTNPPESDFTWNFAPPEKANRFSSDKSLNEEITNKVQEFTWDFGNNWKRELQEEEILSVEPSLEDVIQPTFPQENVEEEVKEESTAWNFGEDESQKSIETKDETRTQTKIEEVDFSKLHEKLGSEETGLEFEEVKAKTQELSIDLSEFEKFNEEEVQEEEQTETIQENNLSQGDHNIFDDAYVPVQSTSEFVLTQEQEKLLVETDPFSKFTVEKTESEFEDHSGDSALSERSRLQSGQESSTSFPLEEAVEEKETPIKREKGSKFWSIVSAVLIVFIFIVLYWKMWGVPNWLKMQPKAEHLVKNTPAVLEREYDIPVTYPYEVKISEAPKTEQGIDNNSHSSLSPKVSASAEKSQIVKNDVDASDLFSKNNPYNQIGKKTDKTPEQVQPSKPKTPEVKEPVKKKEAIKEKTTGNQKAVLVRDNIYLEGSSYVVQLSSWKSEAIADKEVSRLQRKGIKAFKTSVVIPQKGGTWYRVKVGGFSSAEEASLFFKVESEK